MSRLEEDTRPDELGSLFLHIFNIIPKKLVIFTFVLFMLLNTTVFVDKILSTWTGAVDGLYVTEKGIMIQGILLSIGMIVFSVMLEGDVV